MNETTQLLAQWRAGDKAALDQVLKLHLPYIRDRVRDLLGPSLRAKLTSEDVVQDAVLDFLRNGPRFVPENSRQLQTLLGKVVHNTICDHGNWFAAARRSMASEMDLHVRLSESGSGGDPAARAYRAEMADRVRIAMELLSDRDRQIVLMHGWERCSFAEIGRRLGVGEEGGRAAWRRAIERLRELMARVRRGEWDAALE